jgi:hypothetical protein
MPIRLSSGNKWSVTGNCRKVGRRSMRFEFSPNSECLEARQLMSKTAPAQHPDFLSPPPAVVANAASLLASRTGPDFQKLATDFHRVEQTASVRPGQFALLNGDAATIDQAIESAGLPAKQATQDLDELQNAIDSSVLAASDQHGGWAQLQQRLNSAVSGVSVSYQLTQQQVASMYPTGVISSQLLQQTFTQMEVVAHEAHVSTANHDMIVADEQAIAQILGPSPNTNLGGAVPRDPLTVYFDGQVASFVRKR